jgi:general L-amino acid transport system permease protein
MSPLSNIFRDRRIRDVLWQIAAVAVLVAALVYFVRNASANMVNAGMASGFDFLFRESGIEVPFALTGYTSQSSIAALLWVGVVNTLLVAVVAIVVATLLGFTIGIARLSRNWLVATLAGAYIEFVRNIPLLFFVLFWYFGVLAALPAPKESLAFLDIIFLNRRGLSVPAPLVASPLEWAMATIAVLITGQIVLARWAWQRQQRSGKTLPVWSIGFLVLGLCPLVVLAVAAASTGWEIPVLRGFNFRGGLVLVPEFVALLAALATYTAGFIAEAVRGGIASVPKQQIEAAGALGLRQAQVLRLVVLPQALRIIVPPLTSQYVNLLKNSSFGAAIAYPEIVSVFMGSALVSTGQAVEIIAITLAIYLTIGLGVSLFMNWYNRRIRLVVR